MHPLSASAKVRERDLRLSPARVLGHQSNIGGGKVRWDYLVCGRGERERFAAFGGGEIKNKYADASAGEGSQFNWPLGECCV